MRANYAWDATVTSDMDLVWHNVCDWGVEGKGWRETASYYDRLPRRAESLVPPPVWGLSRDSSGMLTRFRTDADTIFARWTLGTSRLAMPHMPASAVSGVDLYGQDSAGKWRWVGASKPETLPDVETQLIAGLDGASHTFMLYLPLFNRVQSLAIGVPAGCDFEGLAPRPEPPIVYYGTSIVHGASASRPGMTHFAILRRRLDTPMINLGFSGNGRMEIALAELLAEIEASVYVLDCLPNMTPAQVAERAEPFVRHLRRARPATPIVLVEDRTLDNAYWVAADREQHQNRRARLRETYEKLVAEGFSGLHYVRGEALLGDDGDATVDRSHPTDLGFVRLADALEPTLRACLQNP